MKSLVYGFLFILLATLGFSQDPELTNYKSGISMIPGVGDGSDKGTAYMIETWYSDPLICDRKVVYLKSNTQIDFQHNAQNSFWTTGDVKSYIGATDPYAVIRYKVDRDLQWTGTWANGGVNNYTAFPAPFTFATLPDYTTGVPVVGTTGDNGVTLTNANRATYYWRGILSPEGDEYHTITVADDDTANPARDSTSEWWASDGRVFIFVVNPKTPCMTVRATGNGQFCTTPLKAYFLPRIVSQTTSFNAGTGSVTFEIRDITGHDVFYSINGAPFVQVSASTPVGTPTFTDSAFNVGTNTLSYYYAGNQAYTKTRTVIKNPDYPSKTVANIGDTFLSPYDTWAKVIARISNGTSASGIWFTSYNLLANSQRANVEGVNGLYLGKRSKYNFPALNAIAAKRYGWDTIAPSTSHSYGWFAKAAVLDNQASIDSVGFEMQQSQTSIPTKETVDRGYYTVLPWQDMMLAYSIIASDYRADQNANGITAIEDIYIRDCLARQIEEQIFCHNLGNTFGMWPTARSTFALSAMYLLPNYSSPIFGTCGLDGNTTVYPYCPFPVNGKTWAACLIDPTATLGTFPEFNVYQGIESEMILADGAFNDRLPYGDFSLMGRVMAVGVNTAKIHTPDLSWPHYNIFLTRCGNGTITGTKYQNNGDYGYRQYSQITTFNNRFVDSAWGTVVWAKTLPNTDTDSIQLQMQDSNSWGFLWYDQPVGVRQGILTGTGTAVATP